MKGSPDAAMMSAFTSGTATDARHERRLWIAFVLLGVGLYVQQFVTLAKVKRALLARAPGDPVNTLAQKASRLVIESWSTFVSPADLAIAALIVAAAGYVIWVEVRHQTFTSLLHRADSVNRVLYGFLALATLVITRCYLTRGQVFMGDAETHMLRSWMFVEHFRNFDAPTWSNAWYGGFPLLEHYGPLYFIATALLTLALGDIHVATKLLLWGCHVGSVFVLFWYLREVTRRNLPSLVGAMAYALCFLRLNILLYQGDLQISVLLLLYPAILLLVERYLRIRTNARSTFVLVTLALTVMILNHHGYAFFGLVLLAVYLIARLAVTPEPFWTRFRILVMFGVAEVASLLMTSFLLGPFLFAMSEHRGMNTSAFMVLVPNIRAPLMLLKLFFKWAALGDGTSLGYMGLSIGVLAVIGSVYAIRHRSPAGMGLVAAALAALLMSHNRMSYNVKNVDFFLIFACALTTWAVIALVETKTRFAFIERARLRWAGRFPARVTAVCLGLMVLDLGPTTFQSVFRENYEFKQPMYQRVLALDGPYKMIERQVLTYDPNKSPDAYFDRNKLGIPSAYAATQTPLGFFHEGAGLSFGYKAEIVKNLHRDLNQGRLSELSATGLYVLGTKYIVFRDRYQWFDPHLPSSPLYKVSDGILQMTHATPLILSRRVIGSQDVDGYPATDLIRERRYLEPETFDYSGQYFRELVEPLLGRMRPDITRGVADTLITRSGDLREDLGSTEPVENQVLSFTTDLKRVDVRYRSNVNAFGQLPYNYFPYLHVNVDGLPVPFYRSAMNHVIFRAPAGEHVVSIRGVMPPLQERLMWLSLGVTLLVLVVPKRAFASVDRP